MYGLLRILLLIGAASLPTFAQDASDWERWQRMYKRPPDIVYPADNPYTPAKAALGEMLFFDPRLSGPNNQSCATCHNPSFQWSDPNPVSIGATGKVGHRHSPTLWNLSDSVAFMWDGRAESLEEQALLPITNPNEMAQDMDALMDELSAISGYRRAFDMAFPDEGLTPSTLAKALATFQRGLKTDPAPFDLWVDGDDAALSDAAKRGFAFFNRKGGCAECHSGWNFTDDSFHDIGLQDRGDFGRFDLIPIDAVRFAFKTPGLRNIRQRAPYMHDGSIKSLEAAVDHYESGLIDRPTLSKQLTRFEFKGSERADLVAFLESLTSDPGPTTVPVLPID